MIEHRRQWASGRYGGSWFSFQKCIEVRKEKLNYGMILKDMGQSFLTENNLGSIYGEKLRHQTTV